MYTIKFPINSDKGEVWMDIKSFDLFSINQLIPSSKLMLYALAQLKFGVHISVRRPPFSIPDFHFFSSNFKNPQRYKKWQKNTQF